MEQVRGMVERDHQPQPKQVICTSSVMHCLGCLANLEALD